MYGLQSSTDLTFLVGRKLEQLRLGEFDVQFSFDLDITISVQSRINYISEQESTLISAEHPYQTKDLWQLIGLKVLKIEILADGNLSISFDSDKSIIIIEIQDNFESYTIWNNGKFIAI